MQLDKIISILRRAETQDAAGQVRATWRPVAEVWASVRPLNGREFFAASGERAEITHEIIVRYGVDVRSKDRLEFDGRTFDVIAPVNIDERNRFYKLMGRENAGL